MSRHAGRRIVVLGSTGSIGMNTLRVARQLGGGIRIVGLAAQKNVGALTRQACETRAEAVALADEAAAARLAGRVNGARVFAGEDGVERLAASPGADLVVAGMVGAAGLRPVLAAIRSGKHVALANKEVLVMAGDLVMSEARRHRVDVLPVDSEHSAILQCLIGACGSTGGPGSFRSPRGVRRLILTASGGPFYRRDPRTLARVTVKGALAHPTWRMGRKITVDSATLMNKGFEVIEAHHLFGIPLERISIVIHPQSIVHSMVEFEDGAVIAQLGLPDMRVPIQFALTYPRHVGNRLPSLDLPSLRRLEFDTPDFRKFPCLRLALSAARAGGTAPAVLNGSNEVAVAAFLAGRIPFTGIARTVQRVLARHRVVRRPALADILTADAWARAEAERIAA